MSHLVRLPARRLEQNRRTNATVYVAKWCLGIGIERLAMRLLTGNVGVDRRDESRLSEQTEHDAAKSRL